MSNVLSLVLTLLGKGEATFTLLKNLCNQDHAMILAIVNGDDTTISTAFEANNAFLAPLESARHGGKRAKWYVPIDAQTVLNTARTAEEIDGMFHWAYGYWLLGDH